MNSIHNNSYGIEMHTQLCDSNYFLKNNISHGDYGIYLRSSTSSISNQNNIFSENYVIDNEIVPIKKQIEVEKLELKNYECPFCGEIIDAQLIQMYKDGPTVKCKYCEVNIPKDELE